MNNNIEDCENSIAKFDELLIRCHQRQSSIYCLKSLYNSMEHEFLFQMRYNSIRQYLMKSFPIVASINDIYMLDDYETFEAHAQDIYDDYWEFVNEFQNIVLFLDDCLEVLKEMMKEFNELHMGKNKILVIYFNEICFSYFKVMWLFSTIESSKIIFLLVELCHNIFRMNNIETYGHLSTYKIVKLLYDCDNIHIALMTTFQPFTTIFESMILQFQNPVVFVDNHQVMRDSGVFNSLHHENMKKEKLNQLATHWIPCKTGVLPAYIEMKDTSKYIEYSLFIYFVCPSLLLNSSLFEFFQFLFRRHLFISLYRDMTFNIHLEFEILCHVTTNLVNVYEAYMSEVSTSPIVNRLYSKSLHKHMLELTKTLQPMFHHIQLSKSLREISKECLIHLGEELLHRREYFISELESINQLLAMSPGLVGPKLPRILALAKVSKDELIRQACISEFLSKKSIRKDCIKYFDINKFDGLDCVTLIAKLRTLSSFVRVAQDQQVIFHYYLEYLSNIDLKKLIDICQRCQILIPSFNDFFRHLVSDLEAIISLASLHKQDTKEKLTELIRYFKFEWNRFLYHLHLQSNNFLLSKYQILLNDLYRCMQGIYSRCQYLDSNLMKPFIINLVEPHELWWYQSFFKDMFFSSMTSPVRLSYDIFGLFTLLPIISMVLADQVILIHYLRGEEDCELIQKALVVFMDDRLDDYGKVITSICKSLCQHLHLLEMQVIPPTAFDRIKYSLEKKLALLNNDDDIDLIYQDWTLFMAYDLRVNPYSPQNPNANANVNVSEEGEVIEEPIEIDPISSLHPEDPPGMESQAFAKQSIEKLVDFRLILSNLISMTTRVDEVYYSNTNTSTSSIINDTNGIIIYDRFYSLMLFAKQRLLIVLEDSLIKLFDYRNIPPSYLISSFLSICQAVQVGLVMINFNVYELVKILLFKSTCDLSLSPPGTIPKIIPFGDDIDDQDDNNEEEHLIWSDFLVSLIEWFQSLCQGLVEDTSLTSQLIWLPSSNSFHHLPWYCITNLDINTSNDNRNPNENESYLNGNIFKYEIFLSVSELSCISQLIGTQGYRVLEHELLQMIRMKLKTLYFFLNENSIMLVSISNAFRQYDCFDIHHQLKDKLDQFREAWIVLRQISLLLIIRQMLLEAQEKTIKAFAPSLQHMLCNSMDVLNMWKDQDLTRSLQLLAHDLGVIGSSPSAKSQDTSLQELLQQIVLEAEILSIGASWEVWTHLPLLVSLMHFDYQLWTCISQTKAQEQGYSYASFIGNFHCVMFGIIKVLVAFPMEWESSILAYSYIINTSQAISYSYDLIRDDKDEHDITNILKMIEYFELFLLFAKEFQVFEESTTQPFPSNLFHIAKMHSKELLQHAT